MSINQTDLSSYDPFRKCSIYWELADHIPYRDLLSYWCEGNDPCVHAKTAALASAIANGDVHAINDKGYPVSGADNDILLQMHRNKIRVHRESFRTWAIEISVKEEEIKRVRSATAPLHEKDGSALKVLGALLQLLVEKESTGGQQYSSFESQNSIITALEATFGGDLRGFSQSSLEKIFAAAKRNFKTID